MIIQIMGGGEYWWTPFSTGHCAPFVWAMIDALEAFISGDEQ